MLCIDVGIGMMWGDYFSLLLMKYSVYDVLVLAKFQPFLDKIQSVQLLSPSFFSFSEEEKRSKKRGTFFSHA